MLAPSIPFATGEPLELHAHRIVGVCYQNVANPVGGDETTTYRDLRTCAETETSDRGHCGKETVVSQRWTEARESETGSIDSVAAHSCLIVMNGL
jgi:hypothetical protein